MKTKALNLTAVRLATLIVFTAVVLYANTAAANEVLVTVENSQPVFANTETIGRVGAEYSVAVRVGAGATEVRTYDCLRKHRLIKAKRTVLRIPVLPTDPDDQVLNFLCPPGIGLDRRIGS